MPDVTIKAGRAYQVMQTDRRADLHELRDLLNISGVIPALEITEYVPGQYGGVHWVESIAIYIGGAAGGAMTTRLINDVYDVAKKWAIARYKRKHQEGSTGNSRPQAFTIYGPDGEVLKNWKIDQDGEQEP